MPNIDWVDDPDAPHRRGIRLARPARRNAIDLAMLLEIREALAVWERDPAITELCISSAVPGMFSAGGDIAAFVGDGALDPAYQRRFLDTEYVLLAAIRASRLRTVCRVDGLAMGGGLGLAMACSRRLIGRQAVFAMPELAIGLIPDVGASGFLARPSVGHGLVMALSGYRAAAGEAARWGWGESPAASEASAVGGLEIDALAGNFAALGSAFDGFAHLEKVLPEGDHARVFAGRCSALSATVFWYLLNEGRVATLGYPQRLAVERDLVGKLTASGEFPKGIAAFLGKRRADFEFGTLAEPLQPGRCLSLARQWVADSLGQAVLPDTQEME
nr:enoyl-CoA hydratase/isomerase family protein [Dechloromonas sp.]